MSVVWFTNMKSGKERKPLQLKTMKENGIEYQKYDNYDAIDIPNINNIPSDYKGLMGVPITWLGKYCPEQFEIITYDNNPSINNKIIYKRIFVKLK